MFIKDLNPNDFIKTSNSLNSLSPYIGRLRPECVDFLINSYADPQKPIFDPFCGSGTVLLQGWVSGYKVYGNDLNPYAFTLSMGKMNPYEGLEEALAKLNLYRPIADNRAVKVNLETIPEWIKEFYNTDTLKEIIAWSSLLKSKKEWFLLSCLLGILHHQRPGFLSYPASHGAPYLRSNKYPRDQYPEMYEYRNVYEKLSQKIQRVYKSFPELNFDQERIVYNKDASTMHLKGIEAGTIITSPPYMRSLTYARDNRLRLWFLGEDDWETLDGKISPKKEAYSQMMSRCFRKWAGYQDHGDKCVIVIGDIKINSNPVEIALAQHLENISKRYYRLNEAYQDPIPESHKLVKGHNTIKREIIVVLERK